MTIFPLTPKLKKTLLKISDTFGMVLLYPVKLLLDLVEWSDKKFGPKYGEWQEWFAWRPVEIGYYKGPIVWLETVERTRTGPFTIYRKLGDTAMKAPWGDDDECG